MSAKHEPGLCRYCQTQMVNSGSPIWEDYCPDKDCDGEAKAFRRAIAESSRRAKAQNQLMEAAPDLLAALKAMLPEANQDEAHCRPRFETCEIARSAIAKAEGRS